MKVVLQLCSFKKILAILCLLISMYVLGTACQFLQKKPAGILIEIELNLWINLGRTCILTYWVFQSMKMDCLSILDHTRLPSAIFWKFYCTNLAFLLLNLFLYFFLVILNLILFSDDSFLYIEMQFIFILYSATLLKLFNSGFACMFVCT